MKYPTSLISSALLLSVATLTHAAEHTEFHFTKEGSWDFLTPYHLADDMPDYTFNSVDNTLTATATAYDHKGIKTNLGGLYYDGIGVDSGFWNIEALQNKETLKITFSDTVSVGKLHLRQWELADKVHVKAGTFTDGDTINFTLDNNFASNSFKSSEIFNTSNLLTNVDYIKLTGGSLGTATLLASMEDVSKYAATASSEVPIPAAAWLFGSAMAALGIFGRKK